jgi:hypothetical protein
LGLPQKVLQQVATMLDTLEEVGRQFKVSYAAISRAVKANEKKMSKCKTCPHAPNYSLVCKILRTGLNHLLDKPLRKLADKLLHVPVVAPAVNQAIFDFVHGGKSMLYRLA